MIPFIDPPTPVILANNCSALKHANFVERSIGELLDKGCIREVTSPFVVNPLTVSVNSSGKERLVLDLRHVNKFVDKQKVKFEGVKEAMSFIYSPGYAFKYDLKSGYHHLDIHPQHQKFLGFSWKFDSQLRYFEFTVLPFGLSSAGHIFTKTVRVLVKHWRSLGFPIVMYLDDGFATAEDFHICQKMSLSVQNDLLQAGFIANNEKSVWEPKQLIEWLGFEWNVENSSLQIPQKKIEILRDSISNIVEKNINLSCRNLAKVCGKIVSMIPALGNICQIMTKHMHMTICCKCSWDEIIGTMIFLQNYNSGVFSESHFLSKVLSL